MDNAIAHCCVLVMFACRVGAEVPSVMYLFLQGGGPKMPYYRRVDHALLFKLFSRTLFSTLYVVSGTFSI